MRDPCKQKIGFPKLSSHHPAPTHTHLHWKWGKREAVFKTSFPYESKIGRALLCQSTSHAKELKHCHSLYMVQANLPCLRVRKVITAPSFFLLTQNFIKNGEHGSRFSVGINCHIFTGATGFPISLSGEYKHYQNSKCIKIISTFCESRCTLFE